MATLLREFVALEYDRDAIKESLDANKPIVVKALLQRADAVNQNKRSYPRHILEREVTNYMKAVKERRALGQLDHPDTSIVELRDASHLITDIWWQGDEVWGNVEVLDTPNGRIVKDLLKNHITLGISSRGIGEVSEQADGTSVVTEEFLLLCWDIVSEPSTQNAWLFTEGKNVDPNKVKRLIPKRDRLNRIVNEILK